jgi:uncharacterized protein YhaN
MSELFKALSACYPINRELVSETAIYRLQAACAALEQRKEPPCETSQPGSSPPSSSSSSSDSQSTSEGADQLPAECEEWIRKNTNGPFSFDVARTALLACAPAIRRQSDAFNALEARLSFMRSKYFDAVEQRDAAIKERDEAREELKKASKDCDARCLEAHEAEKRATCLLAARDAAIRERDALDARIRIVLALCAEFKTACDNLHAVFKGTVADIAQRGEDGAA